MIKLCVYCIFWHQVSSSFNLSSQNSTRSDGTVDDVLEKFLFAVKVSYLETKTPRHVTIVGGTDDDVQRIQSALRIYPFILCKNIEKCSYSDLFSRGSLVLIFLRELSENSLNENVLLILSKCMKCRILFVSNAIVNPDDISSLFSAASKQNVRLCHLAHVSQDKVELYSSVLTENCTRKVELAAVWRPGIILRNFYSWLYKFNVRLNGCPVSVSSLTFKPKMVIDKHENGSLTIAGGREGNLVLELAKKLNFSLVLRFPSTIDRIRFSRKTSIINDVIAGTAEFGIGRIRPTTDLQKVVATSLAYDEECITWGVPRFVKWSIDVIWEEFSWVVWILVILLFAVSLALALFHRHFNSLKEEGKRSRSELGQIVLDIFAVSLGNPAIRLFTSRGGKLILLLYLYYAMVLTTAYKTQLAAILATDEDTPSIVDVEGLLDADIKIGGSLYDYEILKDQVKDNELNTKMLDKFLIDNDDARTMKELKYGHDYAFLTRRSSLYYHKLTMMKQQESVSFNILDKCALTHHTEIVFQKTSWLRKPTNKVIQRLLESGIMDHWDRETIDVERILLLEKDQNNLGNRNVRKFRAVLILYLCCMALCLLVFLIELLTRGLL